MCTAQWSLYVPHSGHYMYHQFNIHNSTFSPLTVFICFVWISEQTAIISLYNINWLVFVTETESVYCAVRTGYLRYYDKFQFQAGLWCTKWHWQPSPALLLPTVSDISPTLHTNFHLHVSHGRRTNGRSLGTFQKINPSFLQSPVALHRKALVLRSSNS